MLIPCPDELGPWMPPRHGFVEYIDAYQKHIEECSSVSEKDTDGQLEHFSFEPEKEFKDRVAMYWLYVKLFVSCLRIHCLTIP